MFRLLFSIYCTFVFFHFSNIVYSQSNSSSTSKIIYEEIIKTDSLTEEEILQNAVSWLNYKYKNCNNISNPDSTRSAASMNSFLVYTKGMISKEIHGAISYKIRIDIKPGKYRYSYYDFIFEYYKQNRQYKYEPTGKKKPLEDEKFPGWQSPWDRYKKETHARILQEIEELKSALIRKNKNSAPEKNKEQW